MDWTQRIVAYLRIRKAAGDTFAEAWRKALEVHPVRARDRALIVDVPLTLFGGAIGHDEVDEDRVAVHVIADWSLDEDDGEPWIDAFRQYTDDAWHGRHPELQRLLVLAESGDVFFGTGDGPMDIAA